MSTPGVYDVFHPLSRKFRVNRTTVVLALSIIIWLSGSLTLVFAAAWVSPKHSDATLSYTDRPLPAANARHTGTSFASSPGTTSEVSPTATPSPILPFPPYLQQQVTLLEAKDRFFYHGNIGLPEIALTFDDGPSPLYTSQILAILRHYGVNATFFCVGRQVQAYPRLVQQEYSEGHLIGNHTWSHPYMSSLSDPSIVWQLTTTSDTIERVIGVRPTIFRPPYGAFNAPVLTQVNLFGFTTFIWNDDPRDWSRPGVNAIIARVLYHAGNGSIILLHDGGGDRSQTAAALPFIIEWFQQHNFRLVTLRQLMDDLHQNSTPAPSVSPEATLSPQQALWRRKLQVLYTGVA